MIVTNDKNRTQPLSDILEKKIKGSEGWKPLILIFSWWVFYNFLQMLVTVWKESLNSVGQQKIGTFGQWRSAYQSPPSPCNFFLE